MIHNNKIGAAVLIFDKHLMQSDISINDEKPIHYFTMVEEKWKATDTWPPTADEYSFFPGPSGTLSKSPPSENGQDTYRGNYGCGTGLLSRYERLYLQSIENYYEDWDGREQIMLSYTGKPLQRGMEVTGHPWVDLHFPPQRRLYFLFISVI